MFPSNSSFCAGIPLDGNDDKVNVGHEKKRKRIENMIGKPGTKRPRRIDKEKSKLFTSPSFSSTSSIAPPLPVPNHAIDVRHPLQEMSNVLPTSSCIPFPVSLPTNFRLIRIVQTPNAPLLITKPSQETIVNTNS